MDWIEIRDMLGLDITPDQLRKQSVGYEEYDNYVHNNSSVHTRILSISDLHIPFNLPVSLFNGYKGKVDILVLNGDIQDCQSISHYPKLYRIDINKEMVMTREYIINLINMISPKTVIIINGNHEYRMKRYLTDKLNDDLLTLMPDSLMDLIINDGFKIHDHINKTETYYSPITDIFSNQSVNILYAGNWWYKVGKTIFAHPQSYSSGMLKTTEKAVNYFLRIDRDFTSIVLGHTHRLGSYTQGNIKMYEQGCCCDLSKLDYNDGYLTLPAQNGFMYICQDTNGDIISDKTKLVEI